MAAKTGRESGRKFAKLSITIWSDHDFKTLNTSEQWLYMHLVSRADVNYAGVCDWRPKRIAALAQDLTAEAVEIAGQVLQAKGYVVIDEDTEELLIRSFHRNDECLKVPNMGAAVVAAYQNLYSEDVKGVLVWELRRLAAETPDWKGWASIGDLLGRPVVDPAGFRVEAHGLPDEAPQVPVLVGVDQLPF